MKLPRIELDEEAFLEGHSELPSLPDVGGKLQAIRSGRAGDADPALVAQILKLVNSAYCGLSRPILDLERAADCLGAAEFERVALAATVLRVAPPAVSQVFRGFWEHSIHTALAAHLLASRFGRETEAGELQAAALLHDIGKLVYLRSFPDHLRELERYRRSHGVFFCDAERHFGLPSHRRLGTLMCERWELQQLFHEACASHELEDLDGPTAERTDLLVIALANLLAGYASEPFSPETKARIRRRTTAVLSESEFVLLLGEVYDLRSDVEATTRHL